MWVHVSPELGGKTEVPEQRQGGAEATDQHFPLVFPGEKLRHSERLRAGLQGRSTHNSQSVDSLDCLDNGTDTISLQSFQLVNMATEAPLGETQTCLRL